MTTRKTVQSRTNRRNNKRNGDFSDISQDEALTHGDAYMRSRSAVTAGQEVWDQSRNLVLVPLRSRDVVRPSSVVGPPATPAGIQHQFRYKSKTPPTCKPATRVIRFASFGVESCIRRRPVSTSLCPASLFSSLRLYGRKKKNSPAVCRNGRRSAVFGPDSSSSAARQRDMAAPGRFWIPVTASA